MSVIAKPESIARQVYRLLRGRIMAGRDDRLQSLTIVRRDGEGDTCAHAADSHANRQNGIPNRILLFRSIH